MAAGGGIARTSRTFEGNVAVAVGVAGKSFTDECGEARTTGSGLLLTAAEGIEFEVEEVEEALEWVCT